MGHYFALLAHSCLKPNPNEEISKIEKNMIENIKMKQQ